MSDDAPVPEDWERGFVDVNGVQLHYCRTGGTGPPFVISHGVTDDGYCRTDLARELEDDYDVVLYDARGHGRSDAPPEGYGATERAADLVGLLDSLDLENPILFGHSMGGDTVAVAAARNPDLPRAVVLEDPAGMLGGDDDGENDDGPGRDIEEQIDWWQDHTTEELVEADDWFRELAASGREDLARRLAGARLRLRPEIAQVFEAGLVDPAEVYGDIDAPTLVLKADADEEGRARDRQMADHLPEGRLVHVDGAGHCVFWDERGRATEELRAFLSAV